jgi:hypothetical protein
LAGWAPPDEHDALTSRERIDEWFGRDADQLDDWIKPEEEEEDDDNDRT